jgi:VWFA-related protein
MRRRPDTRPGLPRFGLVLAWAAICASLSLSGSEPETPSAEPASDKSIFVAAVDESGKPVKDLTLADVRLREDGTDREITAVKPATEPLQVELLADTTKGADEVIRDIRVSLAAFVRQVHSNAPDAAISLMEFGQAAVQTVPFSTNTDELEKSINRLVGKPGANSVLLEAIIDASNRLAKRPSPRRAIVILNLEPSDEQSREDPRRIGEALRKSTAQVWAVSLQKGALRNPNRDVVLNNVTKTTGGRREFIVGQSAVETVLKSYADALTSQYEVTYKRPGGSAKVVQVGVTRQGVRLHASGFPPE